MFDFLPYLSRIIGLVNDVLTLVGLIQQKQETLAQESYPFQLEGIGLNVQHQTLDVASFAGTIPAQIKNLTDLVGLNQLALLTAIGALGSPSQAGVPVDVSSGSQADIGGTVWGTSTLTTPANMFGLMLSLNSFMQIQGQFGSFGKATSPYVEPAYWGSTVTVDDFIAAFPWPDPKPGNLLVTDTLGDWLARECPSYTVSQGGDGSKQWLLAKMGAGSVIFVSALDEAQFAALKALYYPPEPDLTHGAPIWPGLAGVTLLTPVAFSDSFSISETMQGVLIAITSAPSKQGTFDFDGLVSYRNAGAVAFLSDDGEAEISQPLGFTTAVYCPRSMASASAVKVRVTPGLGGTCTPFTIP